MENYCDYSAKMIGSPDDIRKLYFRLEEEKNFLNYENFNLIFDNAESDDYDWGTTWQSFDEMEFVDGDEMLNMFGASSCLPAIGLWEKISREYNLEIFLEWSEPICNIAGLMEWNSGELTKNEEMTWWMYIYKIDREYFWDTLYNFLQEYETHEIWQFLGEIELSDSDKLRIVEMSEEIKTQTKDPLL
jgi:hypothetical protein